MGFHGKCPRCGICICPSDTIADDNCIRCHEQIVNEWDMEGYFLPDWSEKQAIEESSHA